MKKLRENTNMSTKHIKKKIVKGWLAIPPKDSKIRFFCYPALTPRIFESKKSAKAIYPDFLIIKCEISYSLKDIK